jgi:hypothetical protein
MPINHDTSTGLFSRAFVFGACLWSPNSGLICALAMSIGVNVASSVNPESRAQCSHLFLRLRNAQVSVRATPEGSIGGVPQGEAGPALVRFGQRWRVLHSALSRRGGCRRLPWSARPQRST